MGPDGDDKEKEYTVSGNAPNGDIYRFSSYTSFTTGQYGLVEIDGWLWNDEYEQFLPPAAQVNRERPGDQSGIVQANNTQPQDNLAYNPKMSVELQYNGFNDYAYRNFDFAEVNNMYKKGLVSEEFAKSVLRRDIYEAQNAAADATLKFTIIVLTFVNPIPGDETAAVAALNSRSSLSTVYKLRGWSIGTRTASGKNIVGTSFDDVLPTQDWINPTQIAKYKNTIRNGGEVKPILGYMQNGKIFIEDGHHRFAAYLELGIEPNIIVHGRGGPVGLSSWESVEFEFLSSEF